MSDTKGCADERRAPRGVAQHALECHIEMRGYALYLAPTEVSEQDEGTASLQ